MEKGNSSKYFSDRLLLLPLIKNVFSFFEAYQFEKKKIFIILVLVIVYIYVSVNFTNLKVVQYSQELLLSNLLWGWRFCLVKVVLYMKVVRFVLTPKSNHCLMQKKIKISQRYTVRIHQKERLALNILHNLPYYLHLVGHHGDFYDQIAECLVLIVLLWD